MPKDALDIAVNAGDLVGIIQKKDPMGNTKRWFVDNGITQVHIYFLTAVSAVQKHIAGFPMHISPTGCTAQRATFSFFCHKTYPIIWGIYA